MSPIETHRSLCQQAFTLLEVCFTIAAFSLFSASSIYALTQVNRFASNARYRTLALAAAQQRIDQIMTVPWSVMGNAPALWTAPPAVQDPNNSTVYTTTESNLPLNNDGFNTEAGLSSAFTNYDLQVIDTRTTVITKLTDVSGNTGGNSRLLSAKVTVQYTYRGKQFTVVLSTLRSTDDF